MQMNTTLVEVGHDYILGMVSTNKSHSFALEKACADVRCIMCMQWNIIQNFLMKRPTGNYLAEFSGNLHFLTSSP
jgi:hypothetical protein